MYIILCMHTMCNAKIKNVAHPYLQTFISCFFWKPTYTSSLIVKYETYCGHSEPTMNTRIISSSWCLEAISTHSSLLGFEFCNVILLPTTPMELRTLAHNTMPSFEIRSH
jgi:hypothetical protein